MRLYIICENIKLFHVAKIATRVEATTISNHNRCEIEY